MRCVTDAHGERWEVEFIGVPAAKTHRADVGVPAAARSMIVFTASDGRLRIRTTTGAMFKSMTDEVLVHLLEYPT